ncbi:MAG TPA: hypothetical protein V6D12_25200 [Candidatus Obscuribacterales bacterium]
MKQTQFILKVLLISGGLSVLIKYAGPILYIPATSINALIAVFVPTLILAIALLWRAYTQRQPT